MLSTLAPCDALGDSPPGIHRRAPLFFGLFRPLLQCTIFHTAPILVDRKCFAILTQDDLHGILLIRDGSSPLKQRWEHSREKSFPGGDAQGWITMRNFIMYFLQEIEMASRSSSCFFSWFYPRRAKIHGISQTAFLTTNPQSHGFLLIGINFCP